MHNLIPLDTDPIEDFDLICQSKQEQAYFILEKLRPDVLIRYAQYKAEFNANTLQRLAKKSYTPQAGNYLKKCYSDSTIALDKLIARIKDNQPDHLRSICQLCGIDTDNTIDHYVPQSDYPEFSVNHLNLFPCCAVCNPIKNNYWISKDPVYRGILNLYTDKLPLEQFLFAEVRYFRNFPIMKFRIQNINHINPQLYQVIENHFTRIKLIEKYNDKTTNIYRRIVNAYKGKKIFKNNPALIQESLKQQAENHFQSFGRNHYEGVLMEALANNMVFLNLFH